MSPVAAVRSEVTYGDDRARLCQPACSTLFACALICFPQVDSRRHLGDDAENGGGCNQRHMARSALTVRTPQNDTGTQYDPGNGRVQWMLSAPLLSHCLTVWLYGYSFPVRSIPQSVLQSVPQSVSSAWWTPGWPGQSGPPSPHSPIATVYPVPFPLPRCGPLLH